MYVLSLVSHAEAAGVGGFETSNGRNRGAVRSSRDETGSSDTARMRRNFWEGVHGDLKAAITSMPENPTTFFGSFNYFSDSISCKLCLVFQRT